MGVFVHKTKCMMFTASNNAYAKFSRRIIFKFFTDWHRTLKIKLHKILLMLAESYKRREEEGRGSEEEEGVRRRRE